MTSASAISAAPLTQAQPDLYIDVQNAASMLFRLELLGIHVGDRWNEIADKAEARIGDCLSAFTLPHWMMALAGDGPRRVGAAHARWACARSAAGEGTVAAHRVAMSRCRSAKPCWRTGAANTRARLDLMRPVLDDMHQLGGSHAQQDVLMQLFLDSAVKADCADDVRLILDHAGARVSILDKRVGYAQAVAAIRALTRRSIDGHDHDRRGAASGAAPDGVGEAQRSRGAQGHHPGLRVAGEDLRHLVPGGRGHQDRPGEGEVEGQGQR